MSASVADKLAEARKLVSKNWTQGDYNRNGRVCAIGAICEVTGIGPGHVEYGQGGYSTYLARAIGIPSGYYITAWNDEAERTQAEVIEAFRKAEALAREEASK